MNEDRSESEPSSSETPDFDDWESPETLLMDHPIRERMFDVALQLREPTPVADIANRVDCDTETARDYLDWFATIGLVVEHSGRPVRYELNPSYLRWRRIDHIRNTYTEDELKAEFREIHTNLQTYRERFETMDPKTVSLVNVADENELETVWEALSEWKTLQRRAELIDAARRDDLPTSGVSRIDA